MTLDRDDELLTALSRGVRPDPDDAIAELLADWHADLDTAVPPVAAARRRRWLRPIAVGLAAGALVLGGTTAMAATAQPGSPLWPITQAVYPHRAQARTAELAATRLLDRAAAAIAEHRYGDAVTALNDAARQINLITDAAPRDRLVQRWVDLRAALLAAVATPPYSGTPTATRSPAATPSPAPSAAPSAGRSGGAVLPSLLPSLPVLPLPSILPSLPQLLP